ncbi:E1A-binding protein p400 [Discoglossus pictus]
MHHGNGPPNTPRQLQRSRSFTGNEGEEASLQTNLTQSTAPSFAPAVSTSGPQSPSYQIQQLIMSRNPVAGQNVNITLQNVGPVVAGNQQITLTPLPIPSPASPGFQFSSQPRRFEHGSPSYIQVTSPMSQQVQTQSPTQPTAVPIQALQGVRTGTAGASLGMCSQSPTRGFVDASVLVRQISLSPSNGGHFVFQEGAGIAQIAQATTAPVQLPSGAAQVSMRERRLSQPHSQTGGTIHHLGPQSPVASGANMQTLTTPSHITTTSLPPQISSIIQGQLIQQQQVLHSQQMSRTISFDRSSGGMIAGVTGASAFSMTTPPTPTSPSRATGPQGLSNLPLTPSVSTTMKKQPKKLEEIPPANQEDARMRKQCLEHHQKSMKGLKEAFKDYLVELFFLQHFQGNMMDFLAFKKKPTLGLQGYLRQNDLDLEEEEEEEQSEVINDEVKIVTGKDGQTGTPVAIATQLPPNVSAAFSSQQQPFQQTLTGTGAVGAVTTIDIEAFKRQQVLTQADPSKRPRLDVSRHGMVFQHPGVASGVPLQQLMPTAQGGMPPTPQTVQLTGQKQNQQQYDPSKGPPVQNAASLHTPPPQLPGRVQASNIPISSLPAALHLAQQQQQITEAQIQTQIQVQVKPQPPSVPIPVSSQSQLPSQISQPLQPAFHTQIPITVSQSQAVIQQQTVTLVRQAAESQQPRLGSNSQPTSFVAPVALSTTTNLASFPPPTNRTNPVTNKAISSAFSKALGSAVTAGTKTQAVPQSAGITENSQDKLAEQVKLENHVHQRISELRKEGLWSLKRLPKLQEPSRPKSHWDYLLEEMQWMAADFAQERTWKIASAKKLVRTAARHHEEKRVNTERAKREEESKLKSIAASIAREIEYFWSNIEQVVEIKLQMEFQEKRRKALNLNMDSMKGPLKAIEEACVKYEQGSSKVSPSWRKRKASSSWNDAAVEDEEETIAEQETKEGNIDHKAELSELAREADLPLDDLVKKYEGAYDENFHWPRSVSHNEEEKHSMQEKEELTTESDRHQKHTILIDSLLCTDQYRTADRASSGHLGSRKHTKDIGDVARAAELLLPSGSARITCAVKTSPPPLLHGSLREYQQIGLDWLAKQYKKNLNGILADENGLGKNVQVIALLAHLASNEGYWGPHLIVVRSCKILKWELEFKRWCPGLKLLLYFGKQRELRKKRQEWKEPNSFNVCITSYKQLFKGRQAFMKIRWKYLVLDEVHQIKSMTEKHWDAILNLPSQHRLLLRDTPLPNTWWDHWTMVHFLIPGISRAYLDFPVKIGSEENQENCHKLFIMLHRTVRPFILRRTKRDVEKQLTKKYDHVLKCRLSNRQRALYEDVILQPGTQEALKGGHFVSVLHVLMQLQRICNHPELVDPRPSQSSYVCEALQYTTASLVLRALEYNKWKKADLSLFNLLGLENKMTRYEAQVLPAQKVTRKLIEEIYSSPEPAPVPNPVKIKPSRLFQPVLYGQKPEGRTVTFPSTPASRTVTTTTATVSQQGQTRGRSPVTTASSTQGGEVVKIAQLASAGGMQGRIAQPKTPVTLQFQGNTFTLSQSQLRQLTAGQPLQLQGSVLQIVSAPGQQYLRPPGPMVMQTLSQGGPIQNAMNSLGNQHPPSISNATGNQQTGMQGRSVIPQSGCADGSGVMKSSVSSVTPIQELEQKQRVIRERLDSLFSCNERRCGRAPLYGADLISVCSLNPTGVWPLSSHTRWSWAGSVNCLLSSRAPLGSSNPLRYLILSSDQQKAALEPLAKRTLCVVPAVISSPPALSVPHYPPTYTHSMKILRHTLREQAGSSLQCLRERTSPHCVQFPDVRLIQCDSGKLEALVILLRKLQLEGRRVLIFSQMLLMLDILEIFLDFHSLTFLRIDEFANYDQCHDLMKHFNQNPQIFCLLLSTHSHSLGVPYVEADTVIFYDSDLNPVMDSRAQAWCDRIGRTKDIHIYRLVSGNSIEEKLLKNGTKDLIREVAAQGNDFSMAFLTQQTIHELFELYSPLEDTGFGVKAEEFVMLSQEPSPAETIATKFAKPFIEALNSIERGGELDGDAPAPENREDQDNPDLSDGLYYNEEPSELKELAAVVEQLTPIEKYALNYLEDFYTSSTEGKTDIIEQLKTTKKKWEIQQMKQRNEWEEKMVWDEAENDLLTYTREDAYNKEFIYDNPDGQTEIMPIWTPPTPPQDENDIYIDSVMCLMYDNSPIPEAKLPPIYVRKERKRHKTDPAAAGRKKKQRHGESVVPPRSLFDRATPGMLKVRREGKEQKKNILLKQQTQFAKPLPTLVKPATESGPDNPEWLISEDWALLQAVKHLLELPLNLTVVSPAHTPNWDLVSDVVNSCSRIYRSSKQCRSRYENVIIPREEGKLMFEANPKKKTKSIYKTKNSRPLRTSQIYAQDEGVTHTQLFTSHFELMKMTAGKRSPPIKPLLGMNPFQKNPKHASVLAESGINYDKPLPPIQVASLRAERIAKEKKALVEQHHRAQQQAGPQAPQQSQQNGQQASSPSIQPAQAQPQQQVVQQQVVPQAQAVVQTAATTVPTAAVLAGTIKTAVTGTSIQAATVSGNVIVNTVAGVPSATFQPINKRLASPVIPGTLAAPSGAQQVVHTQQRAVTASAAPTEMVAIATNQGVRAVTPVTGGAVVCSSLTPAQTQARSIVTQVTTATTAGVQIAGKTITQAQFQLLRQQQASQVQVPQIQAQAQSPGQIKAVGKISQEQLLKLQKQKMQLPQQTAQTAAQQQPQQGAQQAVPVQGQQQAQQAQPQQQTQQLAAVAAPRAGAVLTGATVANLQVARLLQAQGQIQAQPGQTTQMALAKPPVVSAVVSTAGVTTLPVTVAGISVAIGQPQKSTGGQTVVAQPLNVQQLLKLKQQQQHKALQSQGAQGQATVQQKITAQQVSVQAQQQQGQQQKVAYTTQPAIKTQFLTTPITQAQKPPGTQQVQGQIQVAKLPQVVQQQTTVANIQQMVSASQQVQPQTVTLTQASATGQQQVQVIPAGSAAAQVVQQKLLQQQVVAAAASPQIQAPATQSTATALGTTETQNQQTKLQVRTPTVRIKAPTKPS